MTDSERTAVYSAMTDEEIVALANGGDDGAMEYLLNKYKNFVRVKARSYFLIGADRDDIMQEGMIGLYKAVRDYKPDRQSSFRAFAELCVTRQIITAIKMATRQKHIPLNSYISLNRPVFEDESGRTLLDVITAEANSNPESLYINQEDYRYIEKQIFDALSPIEKDVLTSYLQGKSYQQTAEELGRQVKAIDNALQRIKKKIERHLAAREG